MTYASTTNLWRIACAASREAEHLGTLASAIRAEDAWKAFNQEAAAVNVRKIVPSKPASQSNDAS